MEQLHQEFQRLRSQLEKLASYSNMLQQADENVQETTRLVQNVNEKYENLVDLIWREFNEELNALKTLRENLKQETQQLDQSLAAFQQQTEKTQEVQEGLLQTLTAEKIYAPVMEGLQRMEAGLSEKNQQIGQHLEGLGDHQRQLEIRLQESLGRQLEAWQEKHGQRDQHLESQIGLQIQLLQEQTAQFQDQLTRHLVKELEKIRQQTRQVDEHVQQVIKHSVNESFSQVSEVLEKHKPALSNGIGKNISEQLAQLQYRIGQSDTQLPDLIRQSLAQSMAEWRPSGQPVGEEALVQRLAEQLEPLMKGYFARVHQQISRMEASIEPIKEHMAALQAHPTSGTAPSPGSLSGELSSYFEQVQQKIGESNLAVRGFVKSFNDSFTDLIVENKNKLNKIQELLSRGGGNGGSVDEESLDTIKKVTRNQFQKLLDNEKEIRKTNRLVTISLVVSGVSIVLLILMFVYLNMNLG